MKPSIGNQPQRGTNHTGVALHVEYAQAMLEGVREFGPTSSGGAELLVQQRTRVAKLSDPVATMPADPDIALARIPLLDKLGARLQFERTGVRLYEALIGKLDFYGTFPGGPSRDELERIRDDEQQHLALAQQLIVELGGDPTVVTPCANLQALASRGVCDILVDPRTTLVECLDAIVVAELTDRESWEQLALAAERAGETRLVEQARETERKEAEHLANVRRWISSAGEQAAKIVDDRDVDQSALYRH
jgi:rubrerythrin